MDKAKLQRLKELYENATQGNWKPVQSIDGQFIDVKAKFHYDEPFGLLPVMIQGECGDHRIADCSANHTCIDQLEQEANAQLICEMHRMLPELLKAAEQMRDFNEVAFSIMTEDQAKKFIENGLSASDLYGGEIVRESINGRMQQAIEKAADDLSWIIELDDDISGSKATKMVETAKDALKHLDPFLND